MFSPYKLDKGRYNNLPVHMGAVETRLEVVQSYELRWYVHEGSAYIKLYGMCTYLGTF